jgi:hypothetical protein
MNQFMGLTLIASKDKNKLINKLTKDATSAIDQYADLSTLEIQPKPESRTIDINRAEGGSVDAVSQTYYAPILFPNCPEP